MVTSRHKIIATPKDVHIGKLWSNQFVLWRYGMAIAHLFHTTLEHCYDNSTYGIIDMYIFLILERFNVLSFAHKFRITPLSLR